jgi:hypothetical protein
MNVLVATPTTMDGYGILWQTIQSYEQLPENYKKVKPNLSSYLVMVTTVDTLGVKIRQNFNGLGIYIDIHSGGGVPQRQP